VAEFPTDYGAFLLTLDNPTATNVNNQLIVVNGYINTIYGCLNNITDVFYTTIGKNKKLNKKMDTATNALFANGGNDMPDYPTYQTAVQKIIPAKSWAATYKSAKAFYTALNTNYPAAAPIITETFGTAFST